MQRSQFLCNGQANASQSNVYVDVAMLIRFHAAREDSMDRQGDV